MSNHFKFQSHWCSISIYDGFCHFITSSQIVKRCLTLTTYASSLFPVFKTAMTLTHSKFTLYTTFQAYIMHNIPSLHYAQHSKLILYTTFQAYIIHHIPTLHYIPHSKLTLYTTCKLCATSVTNFSILQALPNLSV